MLDLNLMSAVMAHFLNDVVIRCFQNVLSSRMKIIFVCSPFITASPKANLYYGTFAYRACN